MIILDNRSILQIQGLESKKFLQGLISNDIFKLQKNNLLYAVMLNSKGRFLFDFFIFENEDSIFIDCARERRGEIITKLNFYKLRAKIEIVQNDDYMIAQNFDMSKSCKGLIFQDPRHIDLGHRIYSKNLSDNVLQNRTEYDYKRICLKIPESESDLTYEKSIIAEFDFDRLNAVDYQKGCYVGQELTARTHYKGEIRKKLHHIIVRNLEMIEKNSEISCNGENIGVVLSSVYFKNQLHALALIRSDESYSQKDLTVNDNKIIIIN